MKNLDLPDPFMTEIVKQYGVRPHDPLIVQVSRFDPWKDPIGVIEAYRIVNEEFPNLQLVLAGSMATDDPEGFHYWELADEARAGDENIHLLSNIQQVGNVQINAFQRSADVVMQKSLREGFGLTVSEGLWKGRPVIGGRCGGITLQIEDGVNGFLVDDVETAAKRAADLLRDPNRATAMGTAGLARSCGRSSSPLASSRTGCGSTPSCDDGGLPVIVVSHRGPYHSAATTTGDLEAHRGAGGIVSALSPLLTDNPQATWIAAAMSDDDCEAERTGVTASLELKVRLLDLDHEQHRMHYDVVANGVLWFLHHGMFDHARRPRFDLRFRDAWNAFVAVNRELHGRGRGDCCTERRRARPGLPAHPRSRTTARAAAGPARRPLHPHAVRRSRRLLDAADRHRRRGVRFAGVGSGGLPHQAVGRVVPTLGARRARRKCHHHRALRREPRSRRRRAGGNRRRAPPRAAASYLADVVGDRLVVVRTDRVDPSKNIVRGFLAFDRLLEARPGLRGRVVFVAMVYPSRQGLAEYLAYENEVEQVVARVNDRWATRDWVPILLDDRDDFARSVAGMERYDVLLVNSIRDGLNLVAKEGPAINRRDGVLCLSPETGAYDELKPAALAVHPYDLEQCAGALDDALSMPLDERAGHAKKLRALATQRSPADWLTDLLRQAGE